MRTGRALVDDQVLAVLTEARLSRASDMEVVIEYDQLTIDRQGHGDMTPHSDAFPPGWFTIWNHGGELPY